MVEQGWFGGNDVLDAEAIREFYRTNAEAKNLRGYGCMFVCAWGVDRDVAIPKLKNVWFTYSVKEQVPPHMWRVQAVATSCVLPSGKRAWHYNPIAAVASLAKVDFSRGSAEGKTLERGAHDGCGWVSCGPGVGARNGWARCAVWIRFGRARRVRMTVA